MILMVMIFAVGLFIGRFTASRDIGFSNSPTENQKNQSTENTSGQNSNLTEGQRNMLRSFGLNPDEVNITPQMIACAEAKIGATRIEEIKNGATPSFTEGASLVACYK